MTVRAKFRVTGKIEFEKSDVVQVTMNAVNRGDADGPSDPNNPCSAEDSVFGRYTPNGSLNMGIRNPSAAAVFEVGKSYYLDFTLAEAD